MDREAHATASIPALCTLAAACIGLALAFPLSYK